MRSASPTPSAKELSDWQRARRRAGVWWYGAKRLAAWVGAPEGFATAAVVPRPAALGLQVWSRRFGLVGEGGDPALEAGKRHNVRLVARALHGRLLMPGEVASFWKMVGRLSANRGFVLGAELRAGCVVPTIGGGACLVTNALYAAALALGWRVVERHGHSLAFAGSPAVADATVFWPYVDLRWEPAAPCWLSVTCQDDVLELAVFAAQARPVHHVLVSDARVGDRVRRTISTVAAGVVNTAGDERTRVVAIDDKRAVEGALGHRNCLNCGEVCAMRPRAAALGSPASEAERAVEEP